MSEETTKSSEGYYKCPIMGHICTKGLQHRPCGGDCCDSPCKSCCWDCCAACQRECPEPPVSDEHIYDKPKED